MQMIRQKGDTSAMSDFNAEVDKDKYKFESPTGGVFVGHTTPPGHTNKGDHTLHY